MVSCLLFSQLYLAAYSSYSFKEKITKSQLPFLLFGGFYFCHCDKDTPCDLIISKPMYFKFTCCLMSSEKAYALYYFVSYDYKHVTVQLY